MGNILYAIMAGCDCSSDKARQYLEDELRHLKELMDLGDFRPSDLVDACSDLGIDNSYVPYFISRLTGI